MSEVIRHEIESWRSRSGGIAALSFTRVGGDEIKNAFCSELPHPHFVGTIDAFLFRNVVRPFFTVCEPGFASPRLVPGEWGAQNWSKIGRSHSANIGKKGISLFGCVFIGEENGKATLAVKPHPTQPLKLLDGEDLKLVKEAKWEMWKRSGLLSHSDAAFWASKILEHETHGSKIVREVVRRFPLLIVDELQDTGYFLGKALLRILSEPTVQGVLVGDPDQSIFEFNGARPDLFGRIETIAGAAQYALTRSMRCPPAIAGVASHLKDTDGVLGAAVGRQGQAFLLRGLEMREEVLRLAEALRHSVPKATIKVVARANVTIEALVGKNAKQVPKLSCPALSHMNRAVVHFRQGRQIAALASAKAAIDLAVFGHESIDEEGLRSSGLDVDKWRRLSVDCLLRGNGIEATGNLHDFQTQLGEVIEDELLRFDLPSAVSYDPGKLKPKKTKGWETRSQDYLPTLTTLPSTWDEIPVTTIHGVKGETHDVTIFVCTHPSTEKTCPSMVWWSAEERHREERRIAYVATTRSRDMLLVWVSEECYKRLLSKRPDFVRAFQIKTVDEILQAIADGSFLKTQIVTDPF